MPSTPPYILEDRTGINSASDFDDFMNIRGSRHRDSLPFTQQPIAKLEFAPDESLGTVFFVQQRNREFVIPMSRYLRKTSLFGGSLLRKFMASDGREYKWGYRVIEGQEWSCTTMDNVLVAHYDLKLPGVRTFDVSGNTLTIYQQFFHLTLELLVSLTVMRHIAQFNL